ncbi:NmrA family NAD(P)-binding protein [Undibacterium sp. Di27W]|uniref:NmrA family NAD(P)-binding protein n=1 Tax=Undibacterium sp. Di27W TaxID=3413036 RepID=UPI003BF3E091
MYAITGAFGQTGRIVSQTLLDAGQAVRMIVRRDDAEAAAWRAKGAEVVCADVHDLPALTAALRGAQAAYLLNPPNYMVDDMFAVARQVHGKLVAAANDAGLPHIVALSSVGAQHGQGTGNILTTHDFEQQLAGFKGIRTILRAANFMENWAWSMQPVAGQGILPSMFLPVDKALPMVSARDIGATAAALLMDNPASNRLIALHGPVDVSPADAATALAHLLGRSVEAIAVPREQWRDIFLGKGFPATSADAFCEMFDGFNSGHIIFDGELEIRRGSTSLEAALRAVLAAHASTH